jgi:pilus assembly protein CpaC
MTTIQTIRRLGLGTALAAALAVGLAAAAPAPAAAQPAGAAAPANDITLSIGTGRMVRLNGAMTDLFVANDTIADVQVRSPTQLYIFGKAAGNTTVYATDRAGRVVYSANVRVGQNLGSVDQLLRTAMPEADIQATPMNNTVLLTGTVAQPADAEEAERIVQAFVGEGIQVISRLRTATPQQVMLQVRIAEVSRSLVRQIGANLLSRDSTGGFLFGIGQGAAGSIGAGAVSSGPVTGGGSSSGAGGGSGPTFVFNNLAQGTTLGAAGHLLGLDLLGTLNLNETTGLVTTLAEPTLAALSGETASFLAGGEFPIPISQSLGAVTVEYKQYGVGLAFTPTVLADGRISMRVRPEVSQLSDQGSIRLNGFNVPALTTRRVETTVELGSGQSFMIAGLLNNTNNNSVNRAPWLGSLPIIGALFRSNNFQRNETELVVIVTPYLVHPVSANQLAMPTDGYRNADDPSRVLLGQEQNSRTGEQRPGPISAPAHTVAPGIGATSDAAPAAGAAQPAAAAPVETASAAPAPRPGAIAPAHTSAAAQPGFDF